MKVAKQQVFSDHNKVMEIRARAPAAKVKAQVRSVARPRPAPQSQPIIPRQLSKSQISLVSDYSQESKIESSCKSDPRLYYKPKKPNKEMLMHSDGEGPSRALKQ